MNNITITLEELEKWNACDRYILWFEKTFGNETTLDKALSKSPYKYWSAWSLYYIGVNCPDSKYTPTIAKALQETKNIYYLYLANKNWSKSRKQDLLKTKLRRK